MRTLWAYLHQSLTCTLPFDATPLRDNLRLFFLKPALSFRFVLLYDCVHPSQSDLTNYGIDKITKKFNVCRMNAALDHLSHEALILPHDQRVALAYKLLTSVEPDPEPDCELAWSNEILRRIQTYDTGATKAIPAAEVFDRLKKIAPIE